MKTILLVIGTRPNYVKAFPIYHELVKLNKYRVVIIDSKQHYDDNVSQVFIDQFKFDNIIYLNCNKEHCVLQMADMLEQLYHYYTDIRPDCVLVFGDVNTALNAAIAANKMNIIVMHVESGNRSYDKTMPEEINRILIDHLANYHFVSEPNGICNLEKENIRNCFYVGNPMIDTLLHFKNEASKMNIYESYGLKKYDYILLTLHRSNEYNLDHNLNIIIKTANDYKILFVVHHRYHDKITQKLNNHKNIILINSQPYLHFINLLLFSGLTMTDSGGVQEETSILGIPCMTLRENTERPITISHGTNQLINDDIIISEKYGKRFENMNIEGWDGIAGIRIVKIISEII